MNADRINALNIYVIIMVTIILADHKVLGMPAPSSGPVVALMLNMMEGFNWTKNSVSQPETYQQMIEVRRRPPHFFFDLLLWTVGMQGWGGGSGWEGGGGVCSALDAEHDKKKTRLQWVSMVSRPSSLAMGIGVCWVTQPIHSTKTPLTMQPSSS